MVRFTLLIFTLLFTIDSDAQFIRGKITDIYGVSIPGATVYIPEKKSGISVDSKGEFQISVIPGTYDFEFSSLGYKRIKRQIEVKKGENRIDIKLEETSYTLDEIKFSGKREDRAYHIMKMAISRAPFYRYQAQSYEAESYVKGSMKISKMPKLLKLKVQNQRLDLIVNKLFVLESQSVISFTAPDKYEQEVKAFRSTIPAEINPGDISSVIQSSIYDPRFFNKISPLNPNAFSYYKYTYLGITNESDRIVNKIKVIPKKNGPKMFSGFLYIIEDTWNVSHLSLSTTEFGITTNINTDFNEIKPMAYLPTAYTISIDVNTMGVLANGNFFSSLTYTKYNDNKIHQKQYSARLSLNESMTRREASNQAKLLEKEIDPQKGKKKSLEIVNEEENVKVKVDSMAQKRDSLYWVNVRKVPLMEDEVVSYIKKDSIKNEYQKFLHQDSIKRAEKKNIVSKIFLGGKCKLGDSLFLKYDGLIKTFGDYNFVDGFWLGTSLTLEWNVSKYKYFQITPYAYYSTAGKRVNWQMETSISYDPIRRGYSKLLFGSTTSDYNTESGTSRLINAYYSLIGGRSDIKFYKRSFIETFHSIDITNGLRFGLSSSFEKRVVLENSTNYNLFNKTPNSNDPLNIYNEPIKDHQSLKVSFSLTYTPEYYYRIKNGWKNYSYSKFPTFNIRYTQAIPVKGGELSASYKSLEASINQNIRLGYYDRLSYGIAAGTFFDTKTIFLNDYKHFRTNSLVVSSAEFSKEFSLQDNYWLSTSKGWVQTHVKYASDFLLIKHLPFMQNSLLNETVHALSLWLPERKYIYSELGYSLGLDGLGRAAFFVGFNNSVYKGVGIRLTIPLLNQLSPKIFR